VGDQRGRIPFIAALTGGPDDGTRRDSISDEFGMLPPLPPLDAPSHPKGEMLGIYWPTHQRTPDEAFIYRWREGGDPPEWLRPDAAERRAGERRRVRGWPQVRPAPGAPEPEDA
jgi:hypothetical protein